MKYRMNTRPSRMYKCSEIGEMTESDICYTLVMFLKNERSVQNTCIRTGLPMSIIMNVAKRFGYSYNKKYVPL